MAHEPTAKNTWAPEWLYDSATLPPGIRHGTAFEVPAADARRLATAST